MVLLSRPPFRIVTLGSLVHFLVTFDALRRQENATVKFKPVKQPVKQPSTRELPLLHFCRRAPVGTEIAFEFVQEALTLVNVSRCAGASIVVPFVNDDLSAPVIEALSSLGVKAIAMRCAGYNNVDLKAAATAGITVLRVPAYSPNAVAEHAVALMMALNRHIKKAVSVLY